MTVVHGGDTAAAFRVELASGRVLFAKTHPSPPAGFFTTEADRARVAAGERSDPCSGRRRSVRWRSVR